MWSRQARVTKLVTAAAMTLGVTATAACQSAKDGGRAAISAPSITPRAAASTPQPLRLSDVTTGPAPKIAWAEQGMVHRPDGSIVPIAAVSGIDSFALLGSGALVGSADRYGIRWVTWVRPGSPAKALGPLSGRFATSEAKQVVAWASPTGGVTIAERQGAEIWPMPAIESVGTFAVAGVVGEDCKEGRTTESGCSVIVAALGPFPASYGSVSHGFSDIVTPKVRTVYDVTPNLAVGTVSYDGRGATCSGVQTARNYGRPLRWKNCDVGAREFSPDAARVVAVSRVRPDLASDTIAMIDAKTGITQWWLRDSRDTCPKCIRVIDVTWEDDDDVLAVVYRALRWNKVEWSIFRFAADGSHREYAVAPKVGPAYDQDGAAPTLMLSH